MSVSNLKHFVIALGLAVSPWLTLMAQSNAGESKSANEEASLPETLQRIETESNGNVTFEIPENIADALFQAPQSTHKSTHKGNTQTHRPSINKLKGYRIQVFNDGRNQSSLQARARARGNAIVARFPKYRGQVYTFSSAPNWFTRVGNFKSQAEANKAMAELKRAFPAFAGEMRVVKSQIVLIK